MEKQRESSKKIWKRIMAGFLVLVFVLGMALTMRAQIRFTGLDYVGRVSEYAAQLTAENTGYLSRSTIDRAWSILRTTIRRPRTYQDFDLYASLAIAREDYETAIPYMRGCVDTYDGGNDGDLAVLWLRLASLHVLNEDYGAGIEALDSALALNDKLSSAYFLRAELNYTLGNNAAAVADLDVYRTLEDSSPIVLASLAPLYESTGEYAAAEECYTAGITSGQDSDVELLLNRGRCRMLQGKMNEALEDLEAYFSRGGSDEKGEAAAMLAVCRMNAGRYAEAYTMFHRAVRDGYADPDALYSQSLLCAYMAGDYAGAAGDGEKAIKAAEARGENSAELHYWVGLAELVLGEYTDASAHLEQAARLDDSQQDLNYYRGVAALAQDLVEQAITFFDRSLELEESVTQSLYNRAIAYLSQGRFWEATRDLRLVVERGDDADLSAKAQEILKQF
ncbi:MAG: tetratricopeptide repeat protein [Oscillospiraceae bacterium]|nr:tetratricopeptide repeat protein [Oscillospiraceae bacterium]